MNKKSNKMKLNNKGFTLIELLVVITLIALVFSISTYFISGAIKKAKEKTYLTTINEIEKAAGNYLLENSDQLYFVKKNNTEYQCVTVKDLIDYGFLNEDVTESKVNDNNTVGKNNYIYIERNTSTKTVEKNVYVTDSDSSYGNICSASVNASGAIYFDYESNWSKQKDVDITYELSNLSNVNSYKFGYKYTLQNGTTSINYSSDNEMHKTISNLNIAGSVYADIIYGSDTSNKIVESTKAITKFDNTGPVISVESHEYRYFSKKIVVSLFVKDCTNEGSNCSGVKSDYTSSELEAIKNNKIIVTVGTNTISSNDITLTKSSTNVYNLEINNSTYDGEVSIKVLENAFVDKVVDEEKNGNNETILNPYFKFDNTPPECGEVLGASTTWTKNDRTITQYCNDTFGECDQTSYQNTYSTDKKTDTITIKDKAGNTTQCTYNVYVDKTPPTTPTVQNDYSGKWYNYSDYEANRVYELYLSTTEIGSGVASWHWTYDTSQGWNTYTNNNCSGLTCTTTAFTAERNQNVYLKACDNAGNCSNTSSTMIKIDKTPPTTPVINNPHNNEWFNGTSFYVNLSTTENLSGVAHWKEKFDQGTWTILPNSNSTNFDDIMVAERNATAYLKACDNAGNCSNASSTKVMIDRTPPTLNFYMINSGGYVVDNSNNDYYCSSINDTYNLSSISYDPKLTWNVSDSLSGVNSMASYGWNKSGNSSSFSEEIYGSKILVGELDGSHYSFNDTGFYKGYRMVKFVACDNAGNCLEDKKFFKISSSTAGGSNGGGTNNAFPGVCYAQVPGDCKEKIDGTIWDWTYVESSSVPSGYNGKCGYKRKGITSTYMFCV